MNAQRILIVSVSILLVSPLGCGLKEYEDRIDEQRDRAKAFDLIESQLDERWSRPRRPTKRPGPLRCSCGCRGCQRTAAKTTYGAEKEVTLFRFPFIQEGKDGKDRAGWNVFAGMSAKKVDVDAFRKQVVNALREYSAKELDGVFKTVLPESVSVDMDDGRSFTKVSIDGPKASSFQVYLRASDQFALVFQTPKEAEPGFAATRDICLKTLEFGNAALTKKQLFASTRRSRK